MTKVSERIELLMNKKLVASFVSITEDGFPHIVPLWLVTDGEKLYFSAYDHSKKIRNLIANQKSALSVVDPSGGPYFSVYGTSKILDKNNFDRYEVVITKIVKKYLPVEKFEDGMNERMNHPNRILVEFTPIKYY
ncbi:MAG: pyridoxamine 5'-phosphate oxidase family protein [Candidatus Heimdallarchaeota archaeon]|nr:pyridoxamine 5'-phosphate oxidase family protein [Candidatus Heimdallarchaeota archaeon]